MKTVILNKKKIDDIDLFIFDKDGTIIDIHSYWGAIIQLRAQFLCKKYLNSIDKKIYTELISVMGFDEHKQKIMPEGPVGIKSRGFIIGIVHHTFSKYFDISENDVSELFKKVDIYVNDHLSDYVKILPAVKKCLIKLKAVGVFTALATSDLTDRARMTMNILGIEDQFDFYIGGDKAESKPSPDMVNRCVDALNVSKENTCVVGDSITDLYLALNGKCHFIGVKTGLYCETFLKESGVLIETLDDLVIE